MLKLLRRQLLRISWVNRRVQIYRVRCENQRITNQLEQCQHNWHVIMQGLAIRDYETDKPRELPSESVGELTEGLARVMCVNYLDTRTAQRQVRPLYLDSTQWGI